MIFCIKDKIFNSFTLPHACNKVDCSMMNVIAKESSISKALMFHYVKNKKDFFLFFKFLLRMN
jgi:hypothetical protein